MTPRNIQHLLDALGSPDPRRAWEEFLERYSPLLLQVVRLRYWAPDDVSDCFLFVCEQLSASGFRRLRRFDPHGPARFETWLRAVGRHLCIDWQRKRFGRPRPFRPVSRLPILEQEVYRCLHEQSLSPEESFERLRPRFPKLSFGQVLEAAERVQQALTQRHRWLLGSRPGPSELSLEALTDTPGAGEPRDPGPDPEELAAERERRAALAGALAELPPSDRLLLRLRYEQGLTLEQVARAGGLGDAQRADRRIRKVLAEIKERMGRGSRTR